MPPARGAANPKSVRGYGSRGVDGRSGSSYRRFTRTGSTQGAALNIGEIARRAGVSRSTVSYALSGKRPASEATRRKIRRVVDESGYRPSASARALANGRTSTIGLVFPPSGNHNTAMRLDFIGTARPGGGWWVGLDHTAPARACVHHLGHRRIALVNRPEQLPRAGYESALNEAALGGLYPGLARAGRHVPRGFFVTGVVAARWAATVTPRLTAADVPAAELGRLAVDLLVERLDQPGAPPRHRLLVPPVSPRAGTGPAGVAHTRGTS